MTNTVVQILPIFFSDAAHYMNWLPSQKQFYQSNKFVCYVCVFLTTNKIFLIDNSLIRDITLLNTSAMKTFMSIEGAFDSLKLKRYATEKH